MHQLTSRLAQLGAVCVVALAFLVLAGPASAQDGKTVYAQKGCAACHGPKGDKPLMPSYPKLVGQNADYLVAQLKDFKAQKRSSGQSALMWGMAAQLSDQEMVAVSKWLQSQK